MADEYRIYRTVQWLYEHNFVKHGEGQYKVDNCHTNTPEVFFSLLKRVIVGITISLGAKHPDNYLNEYTIRYSSREYSEENRFNLLLTECDNKRLTYKGLMSNA